MNQLQQRLYDLYTVAPPETEGSGIKFAYHIGLKGLRSRWPLSSLAHAAWKAGRDTRAEQRQKSARKPHNDTAGYVCERKSHHPKLPGHFVVIDRNNGGHWLIDLSENRWAVLHIQGESCGCFITLATKASAIELMKDMATGSNAADFGQHEEETKALFNHEKKA